MNEEKKTLAKGYPLTKETYDDFVSRLKHDCVGVGVKEHCTADALFIVQKKMIVSGIDLDYCDNRMVYCDDSSWFSPQEYWDDLDDEGKESINSLAIEFADSEFLELKLYDQWSLLDDLDNHFVTGYEERWEYVNSHFTKDAAEAFIARKKHDYKGLRIYVDSQYYAWEFNEIKNAILSGKLAFKDE